MVMYEYWGNYDINDDGIAEPIVCAWVGSTVIRLELNPYPDKKPIGSPGCRGPESSGMSDAADGA